MTFRVKIKKNPKNGLKDRYRLSVFGYRLSVSGIGYQLSVVGCRLSVVGCRLQNIDSGISTKEISGCYNNKVSLWLSLQTESDSDVYETSYNFSHSGRCRHGRTGYQHTPETQGSFS
jgi:hypothetical protein